MELDHHFTVPASIEATWSAFNDLEGVAGCFPGASLTSVDGDEFTGTCKIKLGPISLLYKGSGAFRERDESARRAVVEAKGKDRRGNGTASATLTMSLTEAARDRTDVAVHTDLAVTGKPAQFGRGVMQEVSDKLLASFVDCLASRLDGAPPAAADSAVTEPPPASPAPHSPPPEAPAPEPPPQPEPVPTTAAAPPVATPQGQPPSRTPAPGVEQLDLGGTVLPVLARHYGPHLLSAAVGAAVALLLRRALSGR